VLADAIAERTGLDAAGGGYPRLCAAAVLAGMRVTLDGWLESAADRGAVPSFAELSADLDRTIGALAGGLDRPGAPRGA
jgi:hypothetical protein